MIVAKAVNMAKMMNIPVLGLIENMSYVKCPDCGKKIALFGESHLDETAARYKLDILGRMPIDPELAAACDRGEIEAMECEYLPGAVSALKGLLSEE